MSKLYDVISRLEEVAAQENQEPEFTLAGEKTAVEKTRSPWLRIVLLALALVILGGITVAFTAWWQNWFTKGSFSTAPQINQQQVVEPPSPPLPPHPPPQPQTLSEQPTIPSPPVAIQEEIIPLPQESVVSDTVNAELQLETLVDPQPALMSIDVANLDTMVGSLDKIIDELKKENSSIQIEVTRDPSARSATIYVHDLEIAEAITEDEIFQEPYPLVLPAPDDQAQEKAKTSRWLHQAELYRHEGEWEAAIALYRKVWDISKDPNVANNLAAALIEIERPEEALEILKAGSIAAPEDRDIKLNLKIIQQMLSQR